MDFVHYFMGNFDFDFYFGNVKLLMKFGLISGLPKREIKASQQKKGGHI